MQPPTAAQTEENKRLLKELDEQKKKLKLQQQQQSAAAAPSLPSPALGAVAPGALPPSASSVRAAPVPGSLHSSGPAAHVTQAQKAALDHAHSNSFGYFITQDSSFGNLILPVLPRLDK